MLTRLQLASCDNVLLANGVRLVRRKGVAFLTSEEPLERHLTMRGGRLAEAHLMVIEMLRMIVHLVVY